MLYKLEYAIDGNHNYVGTDLIEARNQKEAVIQFFEDNYDTLVKDKFCGDGVEAYSFELDIRKTKVTKANKRTDNKTKEKVKSGR